MKCRCGCGGTPKEGNGWICGHSGGRRMPFLERFWSKVKKTPTCWIWTKSQDNHGYGQFSTGQFGFRRKTVKAYAVAFEITKAIQVPKGMTLDHICRNRICVNPNHLEIVTRGENVRRGSRWRPVEQPDDELLRSWEE